MWNIFDLLWLIVFVAGGASVGVLLHGTPASLLAGAAVGFAASRLAAWGNRRALLRLPACPCGRQPASHSEDFRLAWSCPQCGRSFARHRGAWREVPASHTPA
jgi:hypothetical protein